MLINHEVKGNLARLLATEDLLVEHKKVNTACFNVHTRVLTLPMWETASSGIYDMLVGHEVGHALYTPDDDWWENDKTPKQFVNVVEDARIEKLMKRRYGGLGKSFYSGYKELNEEDFFELKDENISSFNLADRANLYFKIGNFVHIDFLVEEKIIIDMIANCESFEDTLHAAKILYEYCKKEQDECKKVQDEFEKSSENNNEQQSEIVNEHQKKQSKEDNKNSEDEDEKDEEKIESSGGGQSYDPEIKTMDSFENGVRDLVKNTGLETNYIELPKLNLDEIIVPNEKIYNECQKYWNLSCEIQDSQTIFDEVDNLYVEFKRSTQKEVNYLVKEFECRKAADSYARAAISRTGILDCTKLHTYKYNEDLFKKVTTLADGKNHGLVFILDWSGSMSDFLLDTIKQLYNLIWFCKKVNIPFEVYAFTYDWSRVDYDENNKAIMPKPRYVKKEGLVQIDDRFSLLNLFTSKISSKKLDDQLKNIHRVVYGLVYGQYSVRYQIPTRLSLSGTPLNETLVALHSILPKFQKENKLQKVQCVILTDGEAPQLKRHVEIKRRWENESVIGLNTINPSNTLLRDRKTGNVYKIGDYYHEFTDLLIKNLRDNFSDINFIGMRIITTRDAGNFIRRYVNEFNDGYEKIMSSLKKQKSFTIKTSGYQSYFGILSNSLHSDTEFEVDDYASKAQIKSAFVKSLNSKKLNKKILGEFVELIA